MADNTYHLYAYNPSLAAAVIFTILFALTTAVHAYQLIKTRAWYLIPIVIGGLFEWIGYIGRAISNQQGRDWTIGPYIMQSLLLLTAPLFFAASIYMSLARIAQGIGAEDRCIISPRCLTRIFVTGDVLSLLVVFGGGGIVAKGNASGAALGANIIVGGLVLQLIFFSIFIAVAVNFNHAMRLRPTARSTQPEVVNWRKHLKVLYATSGLIMVRNIVRVVEYAQGNGGYLLGHEFFLYVFDAVLMLVVMAILNVWHPSEILAFAKGGNFLKNGFWLGTLDESTVC